MDTKPYWAMDLEERREYFGDYQIRLYEFLAEFESQLSFAEKHKIEGEIHRVASFIRGLDTKPNHFLRGLGEGDTQPLTIAQVQALGMTPKDLLNRFTKKKNAHSL